MKTLKRILSMALVVCMIFTSQAFVTFAEGMENTEAIVNETTIEETTVEETTAVEEMSEDLVSASSASAEEETTTGAKFGEHEEEAELKMGGQMITLQRIN